MPENSLGIWVPHDDTLRDDILDTEVIDDESEHSVKHRMSASSDSDLSTVRIMRIPLDPNSKHAPRFEGKEITAFLNELDFRADTTG